MIQDPVWEQSFPDLPGIVLPLADPGATDARLDVRLHAARGACVAGAPTTQRLANLLESFTAAGGRPRPAPGKRPGHRGARRFLAWAERRLAFRNRPQVKKPRHRRRSRRRRADGGRRARRCSSYQLGVHGILTPHAIRFADPLVAEVDVEYDPAQSRRPRAFASFRRSLRSTPDVAARGHARPTARELAVLKFRLTPFSASPTAAYRCNGAFNMRLPRLSVTGSARRADGAGSPRHGPSCAS